MLPPAAVVMLGSALALQAATGVLGGEIPRRACYLVLTAEQGTPPPVVALDFICAGRRSMFITPRSTFWALSLIGVAGFRAPLRYPTDLYRANHLGPVMFMDEPTILMVGDKLAHDTLRHFSDAAALV